MLSAVVFLGGRHLNESDPSAGSEQHGGKYKGLFQQLAASARIRELIERAGKSGNEWIIQAAVLAARGPRERSLDEGVVASIN